MIEILRVLKNSPNGLGANRIALELSVSGTMLSERAVRNYLSYSDERGWTRNLGRRGRCLTVEGRQEVDGALVVEKVGFVAARVDALAYQMSFDVASRRGTVIVNMSTVSKQDAPAALRIMREVYEAALGMGRYVLIGEPGAMVGDLVVPQDRFVVGTMCSVSINGIFQQAKVATRSIFGGLLEIENGYPKRFTQIIHYNGTSLDPLEIFIRGHMTNVLQAARTGSGVIGASFREVPTIALPEVRRLAALSEEIGLGGLLAMGAPNQPLLDIPVAQGCVGIIVAGGLNPIAAIVEQGIPTTSSAMHSLCDFAQLTEFTDLSMITKRAGKK